MTSQHTLTRFSRDLLISVGLVLLLAVAFALYVWSEERVHRGNELRHQSLLLADELRQSGDDLTRMVRTYVATGDAVYAQHFQDILDIRDGKRPRPENYWRPYWDLVIGGRAPRPDSPQAVPLLELMQEAGFTEEEFRKLAEAKANSDALALPEFEAMKLVKSIGAEAEANRARAFRMLYDDAYHQAKVSVMKPIHDFLVMVDQRTLAAVQTAETGATALRWAFVAIGLGLMIMLRRTYMALGDTLGGSLDEVHAQIARIGSGDLSFAIKLKEGLEDSVLGSLLATQVQLVDNARERKRAEEEIRMLNASLEQRVIDRTAKLEAANKELEAFSYSVSHDLRAPLRAIDGYSRIVLEDCRDRLDGEGLRLLGVVRSETQRMGQLIDALLKFSRLNRQDMTLTSIDMAALAKSVIDEVIAANPGGRVRFDLGPLPPASGELSMIRQVWVNLLSNAVKFTRGREPARVEIGCESAPDGGAYYVKDNGAGFDMRFADKLFGVFQRLHSEEKFEGSGVGLALVQRIIHRHGGRVWAEGRVGEGATFYFTVPEQKELRS